MEAEFMLCTPKSMFLQGWGIVEEVEVQLIVVRSTCLRSLFHA